MRDRAFLMWLADRLVQHYGEQFEVDYVGKLVSIAEATPENQETPNTRNYPVGRLAK